jgi:hypothetical protein
VSGLRRHYGVAEGAQSVHPIGNPISHSANATFGRIEVGALVEHAGPAHSITWEGREGEPRRLGMSTPFQSRAHNVAHMRTASVRPESELTTVGQHEEALSPVAGADVGGAEEVVLDGEAELLKVGLDLREASLEVVSDVLNDDDGGLDFAEDPCGVRPEVSRVGGAEAFAGLGEGLARVARRDEIHDSTPASAVEGCEVVPDRRRIQGLFFHAGHEDGRSEGVPLDVAHSSHPGEGGADSQFKPANPGTKSQTIHAPAHRITSW